MKNAILIVLLCSASMFMNSCGNSVTHAPDASPPGEEGLQAISYTLYSEHSELFVEFKPLVVGQTSKFAAHLTKLGENFLPLMDGKVTVSFVQSGKEIKNMATQPSSPGIFRLALQPLTPGPGKLIFDIETSAYTDQIVIDSIVALPDEKVAIAAQPTEAGGTDITYLKEQAWKVEFANSPVKKEIFYDVVKATGEILPAPGDEVVIATQSNGIVRFAGSTIVTGAAIKAGQPLFTIKGGEIPLENVTAALESANAELATSKAEFGRASELIKDKLITRPEYEQAKLRYDQAQITVRNLSRNYGSGKSISSPISGFIRNIVVSEGQFVSAGQPLASITKNQKLVLKADVSLKDAGKIANVIDANFSLLQTRQTFNTRDLHARLLSVGRATQVNTPFIPVLFQMDGRPELLPGSFVEVFLKTSPIKDALVIPVSALIEEQGIMYAYVQTEGERFQKRELKLGANDGQWVQVLTGVSEGERVVTKGGYQIKLSQASGTLPAHGHEH